MSVMSCSRGDCTRIMCDRHSEEYGYICNNCFEELTSKGVTTNVSEFMDSRSLGSNSEAARIYFESIFQECG